MRLHELLKRADIPFSADLDNPEVKDITYDSRRVERGSIFVAIDGFSQDGHRFIAAAQSAGACAVISERDSGETSIPWVKVNSARESMATLAAELYLPQPFQCKCVGVTGTNGKTSVATVLREIFNRVVGSSKSWQIGTIGNWYGDNYEEADRTTPEAADLFRTIGEASLKPESLVMEVSSHALVLDRLNGLKFDCAIFTNLTQDHLDFHQTMDEYFKAKSLLFTDYLKSGGVAVVNGDDLYGKALLDLCTGATSYGFSDGCEFIIKDSDCSWTETRFTLLNGDREYRFRSPLIGDFNLYNLAAVAVSALKMGVDYSTIQETFENLKPVPGRMDKVYIDAPFSVIVDYAHTPDAIENVAKTGKRLTSGKLWVVCGAGGDRDRSKRPLMAAAATRWADRVILTSDNPRTEDPLDILRDMEAGVSGDNYEVIPDRGEAIRAVLEQAKSGDAVIIAGKGHENYQEIGGKRYHFDDREEVIKAWKREV